MHWVVDTDIARPSALKSRVKLTFRGAALTSVLTECASGGSPLPLALLAVKRFACMLLAHTSNGKHFTDFKDLLKVA